MIDSSLLATRADTTQAFVHDTLKDFFAAKHIHHHLQDGKVAELDLSSLAYSPTELPGYRGTWNQVRYDEKIQDGSSADLWSFILESDNSLMETYVAWGVPPGLAAKFGDHLERIHTSLVPYVLQLLQADPDNVMHSQNTFKLVERMQKDIELVEKILRLQVSDYVFFLRDEVGRYDPDEMLTLISKMREGTVHEYGAALYALANHGSELCKKTFEEECAGINKQLETNFFRGTEEINRHKVVLINFNALSPFAEPFAYRVTSTSNPIEDCYQQVIDTTVGRKKGRLLDVGFYASALSFLGIPPCGVMEYLVYSTVSKQDFFDERIGKFLVKQPLTEQDVNQGNEMVLSEYLLRFRNCASEPTRHQAFLYLMKNGSQAVQEATLRGLVDYDMNHDWVKEATP